ncbi:glycosyltransferase [Shewanella xiamenensis]|uniref:glycosyltransferase n=1 Tax=Shewanella xiamenensis TaxID=332186 RepID=UPI002E7B6B67|nr:glycosyltransferase [Shewanella xiamenensis]MEE1979619.1 glycosyltransferase [Shewanella xiamenensis]
MNKICILLAAYNGGSFLAEQLESIFSQKDVALDVFVSLDKSTDNSLDLIRDLQSEHSNLFLLDYGDSYGSAGKNFFRLIKDVDFCAYDYVAFADQDDIWPENKLAKASVMLQKFDCYSANVTAFWGDGRQCLINKAQPQREWDFLFEAAGPGCTYLFRREVALNFQSWLAERYSCVRDDVALHDWLFYAFSRIHGYRWFIDPEPMMRYRQHESNQVGTNNSFIAARKRFNMIKNKWYREQVTTVAENLQLQNTAVFKYGINNEYLGNLYLLLNVNKLRRRLRDRVALSFALLFNFF